MKAEELAVIKERAENTSIVGEPYVKGDPWKGYEIIDGHNRMTIAELACGATADFFASAPSDIAKLLAEVERLRNVLQKFATSGTRHDTNPTIGGTIKSADDVIGWYRYVESMDKSVRERAKEALK